MSCCISTPWPACTSGTTWAAFCGIPPRMCLSPLRPEAGCSAEDVGAVLAAAGADKAAINTAALRRPALITEVARAFGSQCMVLSIQAKQKGWATPRPAGRLITTTAASTRGGRGGMGTAGGGAEGGEILLTSVDSEGFAARLDRALVEAVAQNVSVPVIAAGGARGAGGSGGLCPGGCGGGRGGQPAALRKSRGTGIEGGAGSGGSGGETMQGVVTIMDYGRSNLLSVQRALEHCGTWVEYARTPAQVEAARCWCCRGGLFCRRHESHGGKGLARAVQNKARQGTPLLGICLGMQLLFESSTEGGYTAGLGLCGAQWSHCRTAPPAGEPLRTRTLAGTPFFRQRGALWGHLAAGGEARRRGLLCARLSGKTRAGGRPAGKYRVQGAFGVRGRAQRECGRQPSFTQRKAGKRAWRFCTHFAGGRTDHTTVNHKGGHLG